MSQKRAAKVLKRRPRVVAKLAKTRADKAAYSKIMRQLGEQMKQQDALTEEQKEALLKAQFGEDYEIPVDPASLPTSVIPASEEEPIEQPKEKTNE